MSMIQQDDLIQSIADALQFISYYHPVDYIQAVGRAYERERSPAAKDALAQILTNSRMCAGYWRGRGLYENRDAGAVCRGYGAE